MRKRTLLFIFLIVVSGFYFTSPNIFFSNKSQVTLTLPKPNGNYNVGTKAIEIHDISRRMMRDKNSRRWMIQVFYPSSPYPSWPNDETYPYMPGTLEDGIIDEVKILSHAKPNALPNKDKKFPVIFFIPGLGNEMQDYTILCEELASQGFVVLSFSQAYRSNFVKFPDSTKIVMTLKDALLVPRDRDYRYKFYDEAGIEIMKDITYVIDNLRTIDEKEFGGIIDAKSTILMGHSFGGNVASTLGFKDERIKLVVDIDSKITERPVFGKVGLAQNHSGKPVLFIRGMMQYQEDLGDHLTEIQNSIIWMPNVEHSAFSDSAFFAAKIPGFAHKRFYSDFVNWLFKKGPCFSGVDTNLGGKNVDDWFLEYRKYIIKWVKDHG